MMIVLARFIYEIGMCKHFEMNTLYILSCNKVSLEQKNKIIRILYEALVQFG